MKSKKEVAVSRREKIGDWAKGIGIVSLIAAFVAGMLDLFVISRGVASVPFVGYMAVIGLGVALQFVGAAIPNMRFGSRSKRQPTEPYRIDS
jgi:membrane protein YqaA with SNARE-associated domain